MFRVTCKMESYNRVNSPFSADNVFREQYTHILLSRRVYLYVRIHIYRRARARGVYGTHTRAYNARVRPREKLPAGTEFEPSFCHQFAANAFGGAIKTLWA